MSRAALLRWYRAATVAAILSIVFLIAIAAHH
jgi:hypothetical protein